MDPRDLRVAIPKCDIDRAQVLVADIQLLRIEGPDIRAHEHKERDENQKAAPKQRAAVFAELVPDIA